MMDIGNVGILESGNSNVCGMVDNKEQERESGVLSGVAPPPVLPRSTSSAASAELFDDEFLVSGSVTHGLAWRNGRTLVVSDKEYSVKLDDNLPQSSETSSSTSMFAGSGSDYNPSSGTKYVVVTGGVLSGIGKGVTASSVGVLLKACGLRVTAMKIDPYLNMDAGTMSPYEHGEVFVLDDGGEVDLDLGNYERFMGITLTRDNNITTGKIYKKVLERERRGDYLGKTVQVVPHVTDCIQEWIERVAKIPADGEGDAPDVCVIELGGTVGDIESAPFIEAIRQLTFRLGRNSFCFIHVSLVPVVGAVGEQKTKPTQHGVRDLRSAGITPDLIVCRSSAELSKESREKLALFCQVPADNVLSVHDVSNIYRVPLLMQAQGAHELMANQWRMKMPNNAQTAMATWAAFADRVDNLKDEIRIAVIGKYTGLLDSYLSVIKALTHAAIACDRKLVIRWIESTDLEINGGSNNSNESERLRSNEAWERIRTADGLLIPGGFGDRGVEGKILAANYARENKKPILGVCLGFQLMVIEYCRNVLKWERANSTEFDKTTPYPVVIYMPEISQSHMGGTMRLGSRRTIFKSPDCIAVRLYDGASVIDERHRHRYEVNPEKVSLIDSHGLRFTGHDQSGQRMEVIELPEDVHPFYLGCQYHPEFKSHPGRPSPPFYGLLLASAKQSKKKNL